MIQIGNSSAIRELPIYKILKTWEHLIQLGKV